MNETLLNLIQEYASLEARLADPAILADQVVYQSISRKYGELTPIVTAAKMLLEARTRQAEARALVNDPDLGELAQMDLEELAVTLPELEARFEDLSLPRDPADARDVIVEIRSGTGGAEAALFAADLLRMYERFAANNGFKLEALDSNESDIGGFAKVTFEVRGPVIDGRGAYAKFKFESGVHRVQRVPATESQGRIHTSTATVAVLPEAEDVDVSLDMSEVRVDVFRAGGHGGQGVNTTDSAVRLVYRAGTPDEMVITCQDGRSQLKNKEKALTVLRSRLFEIQRERLARERSQARASQVGSGERSEKIRTYNYPQNRVTDHRLEGEAKNAPLSTVIEGGLEGLILELTALEKAELIAVHAQSAANANANSRLNDDSNTRVGA
jgi:peptide chain release factor 1